MLSEQKLKQVQELIQNSGILNAQEKVEWSALVVLMNDKQITELEEILQQPKPAAPVAKPVTTPPPINSSSLSHIRNLPNVISDHRPQPSFKPKPAPQTSPVKNPSTPPTISSKGLTSNATAPAAVESQPAAVQQINSQPRNYSASAEPIKLDAVADIPLVDSAALHPSNRPQFTKAILDLAQKYGYFKVLTSFEQSPLYNDYLSYGKTRLAGQTEDLKLTQEEFEFVSDLLLSLQVNRI